MALLNPKFEEAGALPGEAAHWTFRSATSLEAVAGFGSSPEEALEDFESWFSPHEELADTPRMLALFDDAMKGFEEFSDGWGNTVYLHEFPPARLLACRFEQGKVEDWDLGSSFMPYARDWEKVLWTIGIFKGGMGEDFEANWRANQSFAWAWSFVRANSALFDSARQPVERFSDSWPVNTTQGGVAIGRN